MPILSSIRSQAQQAVSALIGERGRAALRERRMLRDARTCPISSDPEVERTIRDWVRPGMVVVDAGAHQGLWTFRLARAVGPSGHVFAFEPSPEYAPALGRVIAATGLANVTFLGIALAERKGTVRFCTRDRTGHRLTGESRLANSSESGDVEVPVETLDALVDRYPRLAEVDLLKVDVEGAELLLFRGAEQLLRRRRPKIYSEIEDRHCDRFGWSRAVVLAYLADRGYRAEAVNPWDFRLVAE
jgi:FkbM family methyltransferase